MKGWVYIITTKAMPDLVKVGFSTKDPELRALELNHTGNPYPYEVKYDVLVNEPRNIEQTVHTLLKEYHTNKEWFNCSIDIAISAIREVAGNEVLLENCPNEVLLENCPSETNLDHQLLLFQDKIRSFATGLNNSGLFKAEKTGKKEVIVEIDRDDDSNIINGKIKFLISSLNHSVDLVKYLLEKNGIDYEFEGEFLVFTVFPD